MTTAYRHPDAAPEPWPFGQMDALQARRHLQQRELLRARDAERIRAAAEAAYQAHLAHLAYRPGIEPAKFCFTGGGLPLVSLRPDYRGEAGQLDAPGWTPCGGARIALEGTYVAVSLPRPGEW